MGECTENERFWYTLTLVAQLPRRGIPGNWVVAALTERIHKFLKTPKDPGLFFIHLPIQKIVVAPRRVLRIRGLVSSMLLRTG